MNEATRAGGPDYSKGSGPQSPSVVLGSGVPHEMMEMSA